MSDWKQAFKQSNPLITYALLSGLKIDTVARIFNQIRQGNDPTEMQIEQVILDRVPRMDRPDYEFPSGANIFLEGYNIMKENQNPKAIPIVLTSTEAGRSYGIALMFYEDLRDHIRVIQDVITQYSNNEEMFEEEFIRSNFEMNMENRDRIGTIAEDERESVSSSNFNQIKEYIMAFTEEDLTKEGLFNGQNYYIPKALFLLSRSPIFETIEQIVKHIYITCTTGIDFPLE